MVAPGGFLKPGMVSQQYEAAIAFDTSASMEMEQLQYARNAAINILRQTGVSQLWVAQCDAKIQAPFSRTRLQDLVNFTALGRGGTDFRPIFKDLERLKPSPDLLVVLTDGDGEAPDHPPKGCVVIWLIVPSRWRSIPAQWGHIVVASNDPSTLEEYKCP
jgi:predicted metal-dependent peptidase